MPDDDTRLRSLLTAVEALLATGATVTLSVVLPSVEDEGSRGAIG